MDRPKTHKWATVLFLLPSSIALGYFVFYLATFTPTTASAHSTAEAPPVRIYQPPSGKLILAKGHCQTFGNIELTYHGIDAGRVLIDVTLLDLDPDHAYHRRIQKEAAAQGFWIAQQRFRLVSASTRTLRLVRSKS